VSVEVRERITAFTSGAIPGARDEAVSANSQPDRKKVRSAAPAHPRAIDLPSDYCADSGQDHDGVHAARLTNAPVARLATTDPDGRPHLVPIVFAIEDDTLYSAVDQKSKQSRSLRRIENARTRPEVTILVDHYDEDWTRLWWIRVRGVLVSSTKARSESTHSSCSSTSTRNTGPSRPTVAYSQST
jgi:PPOX class probable F420-dependent enzyme